MLIYEPQGRALEYSFLALNHYKGCSHNCKYCYARIIAEKFGGNFDKPQAIPDVIAKLHKEARKHNSTNKRVLLCFMTDAYQPLDTTLATTRQVIQILKSNNIPFQILTKGGMRAARDFDLYGRYDAFASTLTFIKAIDSKAYEPGAAEPQDRFKAIELAHKRGIETWASLEPVVDPEQSLQIIKETHSFIDLYKIGILNHVANRTDWRSFGIAAIELCEKHNKKYYVKEDLAKYLTGVKFHSTDTRLVSRQATRTNNTLF